MLDLETGSGRHIGLYTGAYRYAEEQEWEVTIDEFAEHQLPAEPGGPVPYDGIIARATKGLVHKAQRVGVPVVNVWRNSPVADHTPGVYPDYAAAGRIRAEHLMSRGITRFAALISKAAAQKIECDSFIQTLRAQGHTCMIGRVAQDTNRSIAQWQRTTSAIDRVLKECEPPIGVYTGLEIVGRLLAQRCRKFQLHVPNDVAIIAGLNEPAFCDRPRPSLTSIDIGSERLGYEAARMLHELIGGGPAPNRPLILPPVGLVVRESTDFHVVSDDMVASALKFIASNFQDRIGPNEVATAVGAQTRTLQNRFQKALGWPVATEIRRVRVERAKRELTESDRRVADIAKEVGFGDPMRLYEVFRREFGLSPSAFRKQHRQASD
ncbi:MAG: substrate-binding domain-containing protein [Planctomycetota bacterium]